MCDLLSLTDISTNLPNKKLKLLFMLLPYMCQQISPSNATCMTYMKICSGADMRLPYLYIAHKNHWNQQQLTALVDHTFMLLAYAPEQICLLHCTWMSHCTVIIQDTDSLPYVTSWLLYHVTMPWPAMPITFLCIHP